ncbi:MAG TPA: glycosyltransferase family 2 protein [Thermoanaerobaculia bacterium]|nr:glycosyltransferase family 2 protein [Thermoanaerobaculia bacterium]
MRTTAIVAAYNEEKTIAAVLRALSSSPSIDEVIVVSDGSQDRTVELAREFEGVRTIALHENHGKGFAMAVGVANASNDILFFCDGDMYNVTEEHISALVAPVLRGECEMNIGVRNRGTVKNFLHLNMKCGPVLSGIRVMRREVFETVPAQYQSHYKIEAALNCFCARAGFRQQQTIVYGLDHVIKESKMGLADGLHARWKMSSEVVLLLFDLYVFETWRWAEPVELPVAEYDLFE